MSNISVIHKEKLQKLLYSSNLDSVIQGLELLEVLVTDVFDLYFVFDLEGAKAPSHIDQLKAAVPNKKYIFYIIIWILGKLIELESDIIVWNRMLIAFIGLFIN